MKLELLADLQEYGYTNGLLQDDVRMANENTMYVLR